METNEQIGMWTVLFGIGLLMIIVFSISYSWGYDSGMDAEKNGYSYKYYPLYNSSSNTTKSAVHTNSWNDWNYSDEYKNEEVIGNGRRESKPSRASEL
jgi:hypothetical protein